MTDTIVSARSLLAQLRRERRWSQHDLASRSGVSRAEISAIEIGRIVPSVTVGLRVAGALGKTVEAVFGSPVGRVPPVPWAWAPNSFERRVWRALVNGQVLAYPAEPTAAGVLPHDAWFDGQALTPRAAAAPEATLVLAGCDPVVGLLVRELGRRHQVRVLPLLRSSAQAVDLLGRGLVHAAGLHVTDATGQPANDAMVRAKLGKGFRLLHQVRWESGIAVADARRERSARALLSANLRWVNREEGSAARATFDTILGGRRKPAGYRRVVGDHRAVATTVASGWAEAGVCVRPAAAEARVSFIPLQDEAYELCLADGLMDDPRISALLATFQSPAYRQLLAEIPGCHSASTGDVRLVS